MLAIPIKAILVGVGASVLRSWGGWLENVCDEKSEGGTDITKFEWAQLGATTTRVTIMSLCAYFPLNALGFDSAALAAAGSAVILDFILKAIKKQKKIVIEDETEETKK